MIRAQPLLETSTLALKYHAFAVELSRIFPTVPHLDDCPRQSLRWNAAEFTRMILLYLSAFRAN
jgi:hypothetical protein